MSDAENCSQFYQDLSAVPRTVPAAQAKFRHGERNIYMFCNGCNNNSVLWIIIILIILFGWGGCGCGNSCGCGCNNNNGCGC